MKTMKSILLLAALIIAMTGCKKNEETPILDATTEEAAAIMATSFCTGNAGTMTQVEDAVELANTQALKSALYDSSFTIASAPGASITYQYQVNYSYGFVGANNYQLAYDAAGTYNSPSVSASINAEGSMTVTGFISGDAYVVNGISGREGTFSMKIGNNNSITGSVSSTVTNFRYSKTTGLCESGTATVIVSGSTSTGRSFSFTGTLVYLGNYTASLTLSGKTYTVNITTGVVS
jgi:hypothetical protein